MAPYKIIRHEPVKVPEKPERISTIEQARSIIAQQRDFRKSAMQELAEKALSPSEIRKRIAAIFASKNYDPLENLVEMVMARHPMKTPEGNPHPLAGQFVHDADFRKSVHLELLPYVAPKLKAVEVSGKLDAEIHIKVVKFSGDRESETKNVTPGTPVVDV